MEIKTAIEVEAWGDFDIKYTKCIMVSPDVRDVKHILKTFCDINGLPGMNGLPNNMISDVNDEFIKYLKKEGFKPLKTKKVCFSD